MRGMERSTSQTGAAPPEPVQGFTWAVRVYYEDTDAGGIVFYANYLKFFERARTEWLRACGVDQRRLAEETGALFVVRHTALDYRAPARLDDIVTIVSKLGKQVAVSEDFPAFIVNRILLPMINEAIYTLYEGVGNVEAIDAAMKLGAHHPMGPLELADFIGLDTCLSIMQVLHEGLADSKYRPCPLLVKYVEAGWLGRKTQRGFYDYRGPKPVPTR